jgi:hypothetical protein
MANTNPSVDITPSLPGINAPVLVADYSDQRRLHDNQQMAVIHGSWVINSRFPGSMLCVRGWSKFELELGLHQYCEGRTGVRELRRLLIGRSTCAPGVPGFL